MASISAEQTKRRTSKGILAAAMAISALSGSLHGQTVASWVNPASGFWLDAPNWSTGSIYPNNGMPTPSDHYLVQIGPSGASYTVTLGSDVSVDALQISSPDATLRLQSGALLSGTIELSGGQVLLDGGVIANSWIGSTGGTLLANSGAMRNATLQAPLQVRAALSITDGLTLSNSTISLAAPPATLTSLTFSGAQTLGGQGVIRFDGSSIFHIHATRELTIGPSVSIMTGTQSGSIEFDTSVGGAIINQGLISARTSGKVLTVQASALGSGFTNLGTLEASNGGALLFNCISGNLGQVRLSNGGWLGLDGNFNIDRPITVGAGNALLFGFGSWTNSSTIDVAGGTLGLFKPPTALGNVNLNNAPSC
jgi:hypothetical protein